MVDATTIEDALAGLVQARAGNDNDAVQAFFAPGATYRLAADHDLLVGVPVAPGTAERVVSDLIQTFRFREIDAVEQLIVGNKAVTRWDIAVSVGDGDPIRTELCDIWTFDEAGLITDLIEFTDTAAMAALFRSAQGAAA